MWQPKCDQASEQSNVSCEKKHIEIHHHYIWEHVHARDMEVAYMFTTIQQADLLSKPLGITSFKELGKLVTLVDFNTFTLFHWLWQKEDIENMHIYL